MKKKHNYIDDDVELNFKIYDGLKEYLDYVETLDDAQNESLYETCVMDLDDFLHQDIISGRFTQGQVDRIWLKYNRKLHLKD